MDAAPARPTRARRAALAAALGGLLFLVYLVTFSGVPVTDDERFIIDTVDSYAVRGSAQLNQTSYLTPIQTSNVEPGQPLVSVPLYWLAYHTPWVGNVHTLFLFSPIVTALTAVLLFLHALDLGYRERTALIAALLFGLATIVWPYTKTYFREPLTTLNLFAAAFLLWRWREAFRAGRRSHWWYLAASVAVTVLAVLSKEAMLIALPLLLLMVIPGGSLDAKRRRQAMRIALVLAGLVVLAAALMLIFREQLNDLTTRYALVRRLTSFVEGLPDAGAGIAGYLVSPGKAIWWTSPVLLLALGAPVVLPRRRWRESWLPLALMLAFVVVYAAVRGEQWSGGTGWGARYMVPLVPFLMVAALPLIDRMLNSAHLWPKLALGVLALWGFVVQIGGVAVPLLDYYDYLSANVTPTPWLGAPIWTFRWSQPIGSLLYLPQAQSDIRWLLDPVDWAALAVLGVGVLAAAGLIVWLHRREETGRRLGWAMVLGMPAAAVIIAAFTMWRAYDDPRYMGTDPAIRELRQTVTAQAGPDDTIILSSPTYVPHFMNYYKGAATWYSLPWAPGERYSPEQEPGLAGGTLEELAGQRTVDMRVIFSHTGSFYTGAPLWLVMDLSPALGWAPRPVEHYFSAASYPAVVMEFSQYARLIKYLPLNAPTVDDAPAQTVDARFGQSMRLSGYDVVVGDDQHTLDAVQPGDTLGLSLLWEAVSAPGADYTVAVHLVGPDGVPVQQHDRAPVGGFAPTSTWQPGDRYRDNYGFTLPADLAPGRYELWVIVYQWPSLERLPVSVGGEVVGDTLPLASFEVR